MDWSDLGTYANLFSTVVGGKDESSQKGDGLFGLDWLDGNFLGSVLQAGASTLGGVFGANAQEKATKISNEQWQQEFGLKKDIAAQNQAGMEANIAFANKKLAAEQEEARKKRILDAYQNYVVSNMAGRNAQANSVTNTGTSAQRAILSTMR